MLDTKRLAIRTACSLMSTPALWEVAHGISLRNRATAGPLPADVALLYGEVSRELARREEMQASETSEPAREPAALHEAI